MRKGDLRKQAILDVSERLFYQKGYEQTAVGDVLSVLKCSKGSFYHHFESKMAVLETLCVQRAEKAFASYERALNPSLTAIDKLNALLYFATPIRKSERQFMELILPMAAQMEGATICTRYEDALTASFIAALDEILHEGCREELFFMPRLDGMAQIVLMLVNHLWREIARLFATRKASVEGLDASSLLPIAESYRYAIQRLIDAPYGSVEIIRITELCPLLDGVLVKMRLEP